MNFEEAFERLVAAEGGYVNNPNDPGGETKYGISKAAYPNVDIFNLTREQAGVIYKRDFWDVVGDLEPAIKFQVFDFAVNSGMGTAIRKLQRAVGVADDGRWGPVSAAKAQAMNPDDIMFLFLAERLEFWVRCSGWKEFGAGWVNRAAKQLRFAAKDYVET
jgi:lysozyme family protein